jgi:hypothetical protein
MDALDVAAAIATAEEIAASVPADAPPCPHCDAGQGQDCAAGCPGKTEAVS